VIPEVSVEPSLESLRGNNKEAKFHAQVVKYGTAPKRAGRVGASKAMP
jgi:hypothetical protein